MARAEPRHIRIFAQYDPLPYSGPYNPEHVGNAVALVLRGRLGHLQIGGKRGAKKVVERLLASRHKPVTKKPGLLLQYDIAIWQYAAIAIA